MWLDRVSHYPYFTSSPHLGHLFPEFQKIHDVFLPQIQVDDEDDDEPKLRSEGTELEASPRKANGCHESNSSDESHDSDAENKKDKVNENLPAQEKNKEKLTEKFCKQSLGEDVETREEGETVRDYLKCNDTTLILPEATSDHDEDDANSHHDDSVVTTDDEYMLKCVYCTEVFYKVSRLQDHMKVSHTDKPVRFLCPKCDETFSIKPHLDKHLALHSPTSQSCKICNKTFANVYRLQRHMISHDESNDLRKFKCPECSKAFKFKHHLKEHIRIHSGEKPFECNNCGKRFSHSGSYSSHMTSKKCWIMNMKGRRVDKNGNTETTLAYTPPRVPVSGMDIGLQSPPHGLYPPHFIPMSTTSQSMPAFFSQSTSSYVPYTMFAHKTSPIQSPIKEIPKCELKAACSPSTLLRAQQMSPDINSNTKLLPENYTNGHLSPKPEESQHPEKMSVDEVKSGEKQSAEESTGKEVNIKDSDLVESGKTDIEQKCKHCDTLFSSPVELHQHERYLCSSNREIKQRMGSVESSRHSPTSSPSEASRHGTPNHNITTDDEVEEMFREGGEVKKLRMRSMITDEQLQILRSYYRINTRPTKSELIRIGNEVGFPKRVVQVWFQNMRARDRRKSKDYHFSHNSNAGIPPLKALDESLLLKSSSYIPVVPQPFINSLPQKANGQLSSTHIYSTTTHSTDMDQPLDLSVKKSKPPAAHSHMASPTFYQRQDEALNLCCKNSLKDEKQDARPHFQENLQESRLFKFLQHHGLFSMRSQAMIPSALSMGIPSSVSQQLSRLQSKSPSQNGTSSSPERHSRCSVTPDRLRYSSYESSDEVGDSETTESGRLVIDEGRNTTETENQGNILKQIMIPTSLGEIDATCNLATLAEVSLKRLVGHACVDDDDDDDEDDDDDDDDDNEKPKRCRKKSWKQVEAEEIDLDLDDSLSPDDDEPMRKKRRSWKNHKIDSEEGLYKCDQCDKMFSKQSSLARHKYEHSGARPFCCDECGKAFKHKHHLTEHKRLHSGEKPFQCKKCGKRFSHSGSFSQHMNHRYKYCKPSKSDGEED